ncbi:hypothetical protein Tsubulata_001228 [Turnera subulata]|uniref:Cystatin domain-containing protein n=1 Tax=Turnera subulata TaxID=218843 RepID=A0A9Q0F6A8_9ROSI|nr:hypothetical protein Tsubulata_001228 [Turnera subulata]
MLVTRFGVVAATSDCSDALLQRKKAQRWQQGRRRREESSGGGKFGLPVVCCIVTIEVGGWVPIKDMEDPHVREVAQHAVSEHGRLKRLQLKMDKVVEGETQADSGITYRLVATVEEEGADTKDYTIVVVEENAKLHLKSFKKVVIKSESSHKAM